MAKALIVLVLILFISSSAFTQYSSLNHHNPNANVADHVTLKMVNQYLYRFGYIKNLGSNAQFQLALLQFQENYGLNKTGKIDRITLETMQKPRCGFVDTGMARRNTPSTQFSFFPNAPKWPAEKRHLRYSFISSYEVVVNYEILKPIIFRSFTRWAWVSPFTFEYTDFSSTADIIIGFYRGDHGDGYPFDGMGNVLAHSFPPTSGWFHYDADERWSTLPSINEVDLESVAVHEIGHLLGLQHSMLPEAVMYPIIPYGSVKRNLDQDDVNGIRSLYR